MELTQEQYIRLEHTIRRYRLSIQEKCKIWEDRDFSLAIQLREELGITDPIMQFCSQCGIEYTHSIFKKLNDLYTQYEANHIQA